MLSGLQNKIKNLRECPNKDKISYEHLPRPRKKRIESMSSVYSLLSGKAVSCPNGELVTTNTHMHLNCPNMLKHSYNKRKYSQDVFMDISAANVDYKEDRYFSEKTDTEDRVWPTSLDQEQHGWRNRITIPKPFEMCKREEAKSKHNCLTRSMNTALNGVQDKENQIQQYFGKAERFRARPIPAHCLLPLFGSMVQQQANRRSAIHLHVRGILKTTEKPFKFTLRERVAKERNRCSTEPPPTAYSKPSAHSTGVHSSANVRPGSLGLPKHICQNRTERLYEDALVREVRRQLRAQRLLNSAGIPPGMEERRRLAEIRSSDRLERNRQRGCDAPDHIQNNHSGQPSAKPSPNFKMIHWQTDKTLRRLRRPPPEPTRTKPFKLRTTERTKTCAIRSRSADDLVKYGRDLSSHAHLERPKFQDSEFKPRNPPRSLDIPLPAKSKGTILREKHTRESIKKEHSHVKKLADMEQTRLERQRELSKILRRALGENGASPGAVIRSAIVRRKKELIQQCSAHQAEYRRELRDIRRRVSARPLLVTQQSQKMARKHAEELFNSTLQYAGLEADHFLKEAIGNNDSKRSCRDIYAGN